MKEIKLTKGQVATVDDVDFVTLNKYKWQAVSRKNTYYARRTVKIKGQKIDIYMHTIIVALPKEFWADHKDHNGLNNCRDNLRVATKAQNSYNRSPYSNCWPPYKGVQLSANGKKYHARIRYKGLSTRLGTFDTALEAASIYNEKAKELFGDFAYLNDLEATNDWL